MSTILTKQIVDNSVTAVTTYVAQVEPLYENLKTAITTLTASDFIGKAADGYNTFFTNKIAPALTTTLTEGDTSLMGGISKMMTEVGEAFLGQVDPQMGKANETAGDPKTDETAQQ